MHCAMTSFPSPQHPRYAQHSRRCVGMHGFKIGDTKIITCLKLGERKNVRLRAIFRFQHLSPNTLSGTASSRQTIHPSFPSWRKNNRVSLFAIRDAVQTWIAGTRLKHAARLDFRRFMIFPETPISCQNGIKKWHLVSTYGCFSAVFHLSSLKTDKKEAL